MRAGLPFPTRTQGSRHRPGHAVWPVLPLALVVHLEVEATPSVAAKVPRTPCYSGSKNGDNDAMTCTPPDPWFIQGSALPLLTRLDGLEVNVEANVPPPERHWATSSPDLLDPGDLPPDEPQPTTVRDDHISMSFIHSGWHAVRQVVAAALARSGASCSACHAFNGCGRDAWCYQSDTDPVQYKLRASWCNTRWCRVCQRRRARYLAAQIAELTQPKHTRFITLTLRANEESLSNQITRIFRDFRRLRQRKLWKDSQKGGIAFLEITRGQHNTHWHVHIHIITVGSYMPKDVLSATWHKITGDSMITDIRWVRDAQNAARYVTKYVGKAYGDNLARDTDHMVEMIDALTGTRTYCVFGDWRAALQHPQEDSIVWTPCGSVGRLTQKARAGDTHAAKILAYVDPWGHGIEQHGRPPPPQSPTGQHATDSE